jgi:CubicO group peptidase (beta-lactamase class C family)
MKGIKRMPGPWKSTCLCIALVTASSINPVAAGPATTGNMDELVKSYFEQQKFMGAVLVARDGKPLLEKGYGFANLEWNIPNSPATRFRLGSVSKQFTAACILLLEDRGKLHVDDPISRYLGALPQNWKKITIFQLLNHTAGIPNFTDFPNYKDNHSLSVTPAQLIKRFEAKPLDFEPGKNWKYSNSGYVLLGAIIEKVSGKSYAHFVQENIFEPLDMHDSGYDSNSAIIKQRASGYEKSNDVLLNATYVDMSVPYAAGGLYSTVGDMLKWQLGLFGGKLLSPAALKKMITPCKNKYACGLSVDKLDGHKVIAHGGGIDGFNTSFAYFPDDRLLVVVLGNQEGTAPTAISKKLAAIACGRNVELAYTPLEIKLPASELKPFQGTYKLAAGVHMSITLENNRLMTQLTGQPRLELYAEEDRKFFSKAVDAQIEFFKDGSGRVTHLILHQGGKDVKAERIK